MQLGPPLEHDGAIWKLAWSRFGTELAASCERGPTASASVAIWRLGLDGTFGDAPASVLRAV